MEFQLSCFKSWKMMLWKCCTQYASKFGKLSSGHRTGKDQSSFQSQRKAMPKNAQTTTQLHSSHMPAKKSSNSPSQASTASEPWTFSSSHVWMWELDYNESWAPKNWCFWTVVLGKTLESPLDCKEIQPVHSEGGQPWVFTGRTDVEAETPMLWSPVAKNWLICKDSDPGKDWGQEEKGMTEDEMAGWHHWLNEHEFGWTPGVGDGQGGLVCCSSWGHKELDTTEQLNWTELNSF